MIDVRGVVTFSGELKSKKSDTMYRIVNIDGFRCFPIREMETLPSTGDEIVASVGIQRMDDGRDNARMYGWRPASQNGESS